MALCVTVTQIQGVDVLVPTAADPTTCAGSVLLSSSEYSRFVSIPGLDIFQITPDQGLVISGFIIGVLVTAYTWRVLIQTLNTSESEE